MAFLDKNILCYAFKLCNKRHCGEVIIQTQKPVILLLCTQSHTYVYVNQMLTNKLIKKKLVALTATL